MSEVHGSGGGRGKGVGIGEVGRYGPSISVG